MQNLVVNKVYGLRNPMKQSEIFNIRDLCVLFYCYNEYIAQGWEMRLFAETAVIQYMYQNIIQTFCNSEHQKKEINKKVKKISKILLLMKKIIAEKMLFLKDAENLS